eukprot:TRINITY_DN963_c4_g1_i1.p1 TRINITY_DN963_c4_g1~~TRINITY_DN963_c4_g1_i1.p1  ORF type:complete len:578 (-),score=124.82 TRINITY_DN963_c4_g1_i1:176-1909(-)
MPCENAKAKGALEGPNTLATLRELRDAGLFCDAAVLGDSEERVLVHQAVLAAASPGLHDVLCVKGSETAEALSAPPRSLELKLPGVDGLSALEAAIDRLYERASAGGGLAALRTQGFLCDMIIIVGGQRFKVHQIVLAAASLGLRRFLSDSLADSKSSREAGEGHAPQPQLVEVELQGVNHSEALRIVLDHVYGVHDLSADDDCAKPIVAPASEGVRRDVLRLAVGFDLPRLREQACQWMAADVTASNSRERINLSCELGLTALCNAIQKASRALRTKAPRKKGSDVAEVAETSVPEKKEAEPTQQSNAPEPEEEEEAEAPEEAAESQTPYESPEVPATGATQPEADEEDADAALAAQLDLEARAMQVQKYATVGVPAEVIDGLKTPSDREDLKVLGRLFDVFDVRPAWLWGSLKAQFPSSVDEDTLLRLLPYVAYMWSDGPWQRCYARFGWDPRDGTSAEEAAPLQVLAFKDPYFKQNGITAANEGEADTEFQFKRPPVCSVQHYQLADVKDKFVGELVESVVEETTTKCERKTGWISKITLDAINQRLIYKSNEMREKLAAPKGKIPLAKRRRTL